MTDAAPFAQFGAVPADPVRFEVSGSDPEQAARDLARVHGAEHWHARRTSGDFSYRYTAVGDTEVTIRRSQLHGSVRGTMPAGDDLVVQWITSGSVELDPLGDRVEMQPDVPTLFPTEREFGFVAADYDQRLVHLDRELVRQTAARRHDLGDQTLRFDHTRPPEPDALGAWQAALATLSRALRSGGAESPAWQRAKADVVEVFLDLFPPELDELPAVLGLPRNARLRAAVEHIHAHAAEDVTVGELSAVAGLSVRSVQESFRRVFDVSPLTYLRQVRLDRVRADLLSTDPQAGAVGDVARRWGFTHLGRFSAAYHQRFGEYPKQTLRR